MVSEFYIVSGTEYTGPFDTMAIMRKIRNGTLTAQTPILVQGADTPRPAIELEILSEFFGDLKDERPVVADSPATSSYSLAAALRSGWSFLNRNPNSTVFSGLFVLFIILSVGAISAGLPPAFSIFAYMLFFLAAQIALSCIFFITLRMARSQPADIQYLQGKIIPSFKTLILSSLFSSVPAMVGLSLLTSNLPSAAVFFGLVIFVVPGLFTLALYVYAPLLILDRGYDFWEGMETSRKTVLSGGLESAGVVYALFAINFLAILCVLLPLAITLPITAGALAEMYDEKFR